MKETTGTVLFGQVIDDHAELTLDEFCGYCRLERQQVVELIDEGVLHVERTQITEWRFDGASIRQVLTAIRLQRDLQVNLPGAALALQLLQQIEDLRRQLRRERAELQESP